MIAGLVFDSDSNSPLSAVILDIYRDMSGAQQRPQRLETNVASTGPVGEFSFSCEEIEQSNYPLLLAVRHRDWLATRITGPKIERPGNWNSIKIPIPMRDIDFKPLIEIGVTFSSKQIGDEEFIVGEIENDSDRSFSCIKLEFGLSTPYHERIQGEPARSLGVLEVEVRDLEPQETRPFQAKLPRPAGFGLDSKREC